MLVAVLISLTLSSILSYVWVRGISNMMDKHPDYKGQDFLEPWDDNHYHNDGDAY